MYPYYPEITPVIYPLEPGMDFRNYSHWNEFLQNTLMAIQNERSAQLFYRILLERSYTPFQKRQITHALNDEIKHESILSAMYQRITGQTPQVPHPTQVEINDYIEGIKKAFEDEVEANELYRTMYLMTSEGWIRDRMLELFTDEAEHAQRFTFIRAEL